MIDQETADLISENNKLRAERDALKAKADALASAADDFGRVCRLLDALPPSHRIPDKRALEGTLPGAWPTMGDLRALEAALKAYREGEK